MRTKLMMLGTVVLAAAAVAGCRSYYDVNEPAGASNETRPYRQPSTWDGWRTNTNSWAVPGSEDLHGTGSGTDSSSTGIGPSVPQP